MMPLMAKKSQFSTIIAYWKDTSINTRSDSSFFGAKESKIFSYPFYLRVAKMAAKQNLVKKQGRDFACNINSAGAGL